MNGKTAGSSVAAFVVVTCLFFAWGFITSNTDPLIAAMRGIYTLGRFESRWTYYPPTTVRQWRTTASAECVREPEARGFSFARVHA